LGGYESSQDYLESANSDSLAIAMIETRQALEALDDILAVDGIDGIFVGPSDFSIAWSGGKTVNPVLGDMMDAVADIAKRAKDAGKFPAIFVFDPGMVAQYASYGYQLFAMATDGLYIAKGAGDIVAAARQAVNLS
jgi:4-hydroxy-2-oxoheptanedioate aldolase